MDRTERTALSALAGYLLALVVIVGLAFAGAGCATVGTPSGQGAQTEPQRMAEMSTLASGAGTVVSLVKAAQESEIRFYHSQAISIPVETHTTLQQAFRTFAQKTKPQVQRLDALSTPEADRQEAAGAIFDAAKDLLATFDKSGTVVESWAAALRGVLIALRVL